MHIDATEQEAIKQMVNSLTGDKLVEMKLILTFAPERLLNQLIKADRKLGYTDYQAAVRSFETLNHIRMFLSDLKSSL